MSTLDDVELSRRQAGRLTLLFLANTGVRFTAFAMVLAAVGGAVPGDLPRAAGAYVLGQFVGRLAVFAPYSRRATSIANMPARGATVEYRGVTKRYPGGTIALDFNPLLLLVAHKVTSGETLQLHEFPIAQLEAIIKGVTERELRLIVRLGYVLGAAIGMISAGIGLALR
mgnify:CR=1 FL=1